MSISSIAGGGSGGGFFVMQQRMKPPDLTKDDLTQIKDTLKTKGKDTSILDKLIDNFDGLDANQDGKISKTEIETGAEQFGIELPKHFGPPPGFQMTDGTHNEGGEFSVHGEDANGSFHVVFHGKPPDMTKDLLSEIRDKLKSEGKETSNLDKIIENFDALDTDKDGKISKVEMESGAEQFGIAPSKHAPPPGGPPPGFHMTDAIHSEDRTNPNNILSQLLKHFGQSDPASEAFSLFSSIDTAA